MTELILLLMSLALVSINAAMVAAIIKMGFEKKEPIHVVPEEEVSIQRRKELEYQEWLQQGLDNIMSYDGSPARKERDAQ